ncbi:uncharacterized protein LOC135222972 [Macrobrachium nipponense]|uniref:uncharacterized protein LOC135222972 n=1 Tax=Macrobrachium nipponense TaxID=159736 RepID=UPI0030C89C48
MCDYPDAEENTGDFLGIENSPADGEKVSGTVEQQLERLNEKEYFARKRRHRSFWKRPATYVYPDNFGFGVNTYQSMIDYLDAKDHGGIANREDVHLPLLEERCMRRYASYNPFRWYDNTDIDRYIEKGEKIRTQIRQNDAVGISNVLRRTHTNWSMTRKWVQLVKDSLSSKYRKEHKGFEEEEPFYRPVTPVKLLDIRDSTPDRLGLGLTSLTNKAVLYDQLQAEFNSVIKSLAQSRMEYDNEMEKRQQRLQSLDDKFEETIDRMYEQVQRINSKADLYANVAKDPREIEVDTKGLVLRNQIRRQEEMRNLLECVDELTEMNSARNQLRQSLRNLDNETRGLSGRIDDMREQHTQEDDAVAEELAKMDFHDIRDIDNTFDYDHLMATANARKKEAHARALARKRDEEEDVEEIKSCRKPKHALIWAKHDRVTTRPKQPLLRDEVMSDTLANILNKASLMSSGTSESRRINSRARFINVFKPRPDTADRELMVPPSRTELNIDFMAKTLAQKGKCLRRYDIDQEVDTPKSGLNTNARKNYCERGITKRREEYPSLSNRVRYANIRSRARITLLGY